MAGFIGSSTLPQNLTVNTHTPFNIALGPIDTEQSQVLPPNTLYLIVKSRGQAILRIGFNTGDPTGNFVTLTANAVLTIPVLLAASTLFWESSTTGDTVEILAFS